MRWGVVVAMVMSLAACKDNPPTDMPGDAAQADAAVAIDSGSADAGMPQPLAVPTGVAATDGASSTFVGVTWDAVAGATGYRVYRDGVALADVTTPSFVDVTVAGGSVSAPVLTASQGTATNGVDLSWTPAVCSPGTTASYRVTALFGTDESMPSAADTGFRAAYSVTRYQLSIDGGATFPYDGGTGTSLLDDGAPLGTLTPTGVTASAGTFDDHIALAISSVSAADGAVVHYAVRAETTGPTSPPSNVADGWRTTGAVSVQWNRHVFRPLFGEVIGPIFGATSQTYDDTAIAANTLYAYDCTIIAAGAATVNTTPVPGWRIAAAGETPRASTWVTDGEVAAVASTSTAIYIGGNFHYVGPPTGAFVQLDGTTGATAASSLRVVPSIDGNPRGVATAIPDGSGGWYLGGGFVAISSVPQPRLAHITAAGALDRAFVPMVLDGDVTAITLAGGTLYIAGTFTRVGWQPRAGFAAIDATTGALQAYAPVLASADPNTPGSVASMKVLGTALYVGGNFTSFDGVPRVGFAAIDLASHAVLPWDPHADCRGSIDAAIGNILYVSGCFTHIGGNARTALAAIDATSGTAQQFDPEPDDSTITAMVTDGSSVYVAGNFHEIGGQLRVGIASLDPQTGAARSFQTPALDPSGTISALAITGHTLYIGGRFATLGTSPRDNLAAVNAQTGAALAWAPVTSGPVRSLAVSGSSVFVGGSFASVGGQAASNLAVLDPATGVLSPWGSGTNGIVYALAIAPDGQSVFAGGQFTQAGGQPRVDLAELDATGAATPWSANTDGIVYDLAVSGSTLYAGGEFHTIGGQPRAALAAIDATTATVAAFAPNPNQPIGHIAITGNDIVVSAPNLGLGFSSIGGQTRHNLAALDATTGLATSWRPEPDGNINDIVVAGNLMYLCGAGLEMIDGQNRDVVAAVTLPDFTLTSLTTNASLGGPSAFAVIGNVIYGSGLMFNGGFDTSGAFDATTDAIESWKPGMADVADRVVARGTSIIEVGDIHYAAGYPTGGIVIFDP
jgi:hypothetical protein